MKERDFNSLSNEGERSHGRRVKTTTTTERRTRAVGRLGHRRTDATTTEVNRTTTTGESTTKGEETTTGEDVEEGARARDPRDENENENDDEAAQTNANTKNTTTTTSRETRTARTKSASGVSEKSSEASVSDSRWRRLARLLNRTTKTKTVK